MAENASATERATHVRLVCMENITCRDRRSECDAEEIATLADVAIALDEADEWAIIKHGGSGTGAGAFLEAIVASEDDDPDDAPGEAVDSIDDPLFAGLPDGDPKTLRQFIHNRRNETCWDGNNHVPAPSGHSRRLLDRIRGR